jgi:hypothetical protein
VTDNWEYRRDTPRPDPERVYLTTKPGSSIEFQTVMRSRPCWRCRIRRLFARRLHWNCQAPRPLTNYVEPKDYGQ